MPGFGSGLLRRLGRRLAARVAARVSEDDLFEKPRERPPQPPAFAPAPAASPAEPRIRSRGGEGEGEVGCTPADLAELGDLLGPGRGLRVVNHWATWCDPCVEELPLLAGLHAQLQGRATFVGVSWDLFEAGGASPQAVARQVAEFAATHGLTYPSALVTAEPEDFFEALDITSFQKIPQTWVIDDQGAVIHRVEGVLDAASADRLRQFLLAGPG